MRTLIHVRFDTETANRLVSDGTMPKTLQQFMGAAKPEAAYFAPTGGRRAAYFFVDLPDEASLVPLLEPLWELNAEITVAPCMNAEDLAKGLGSLNKS